MKGDTFFACNTDERCLLCFTKSMILTSDLRLLTSDLLSPHHIIMYFYAYPLHKGVFNIILHRVSLI